MYLSVAEAAYNKVRCDVKASVFSIILFFPSLKCPNDLLVFTHIHQSSTCLIRRMHHAGPKHVFFHPVNTRCYIFVNIAQFPFRSRSLVYLSGCGARCLGFNRSRCNEVECCTSQLPFVLDSTPGRKPLSHIIIAH